jgi:hypothetical protein
MTTEELLAMPDDGVERWLIRGELRENRDIDMNRRSPDHGRTCTSIGFFLKQWVRASVFHVAPIQATQCSKCPIANPR